MRVGAASRENKGGVLIGTPAISKVIKIKVDPLTDSISIQLQHGHTITRTYPNLSELPEVKQKNVAVLLFNRIKQMIYRDKVLQE